MITHEDGKILVHAMQWLEQSGLNVASAGNASVRVKTGFLVTPSGVRARDLLPEQMVAMSLEGTPESGSRCAPSSEWRFHRDIYRARSDACAVVHTHSTYASAMACLRGPIPAFHYMVAAAGGADIRCAEYATFGTQQLSDNALDALEGRRACLLANHGVIAIGSDIDAALDLAQQVEELARQYWVARSAGTPEILDAAEMSRVLELFSGYGVQRD